MPSVISLSDVGYRQFGPLPASGDGIAPDRVAWAATRQGDYDAAGPWVRRRARKKGGRFIESFRLINVLDNDADLTGQRLAFVDDYFRSEYANTGEPELTTVSANLVRLVEDAASEQRRCLGMYRLAQALCLAGPQRLKPVLRDYVLPCFFKLYPEGKVAVIRYNAENDGAAALMRIMYAAAQTPLQDVQQGSVAGIQTLQDWHLNSLTQLGRLLFDLFAYLFYPYVGGFRGGPVGLDLLFLFEPAERYTPDLFPRNWLAVASTTADFGTERVEFYEAIQDFQGSAWQHAAHQRYQHSRGYTVGQRLDLLRWYIERINRLLYELTDVANFTEGRSPEGLIDPVFAFEHHLSVDRLARKTLLSLSLEEVGTAKHIIFEIAELYDGMSMLFGNHAGATNYFKSLFHSQEGPGLLRDRLGQLPPPFSTELPALADQLYHRIEETVISSVWLKSKVVADGVLVRNRDLSQEELVDRPRFVAELMRCYRNAHHGYFTAAPGSNNRPSRYLFLVNGDLPAEMMALPALWWLSYLADPDMVGWKHLPINEYD